jgi:hypothetical protein
MASQPQDLLRRIEQLKSFEEQIVHYAGNLIKQQNELKKTKDLTENDKLVYKYINTIHKKMGKLNRQFKKAFQELSKSLVQPVSLSIEPVSRSTCFVAMAPEVLVPPSGADTIATNFVSTSSSSSLGLERQSIPLPSPAAPVTVLSNPTGISSTTSVSLQSNISSREPSETAKKETNKTPPTKAAIPIFIAAMPPEVLAPASSASTIVTNFVSTSSSSYRSLERQPTIPPSPAASAHSTRASSIPPLIFSHAIVSNNLVTQLTLLLVDLRNDKRSDKSVEQRSPEVTLFNSIHRAIQAFFGKLHSISSNFSITLIEEKKLINSICEVVAALCFKGTEIPPEIRNQIHATSDVETAMNTCLEDFSKILHKTGISEGHIKIGINEFLTTLRREIPISLSSTLESQFTTVLFQIFMPSGRQHLASIALAPAQITTQSSESYSSTTPVSLRSSTSSRKSSEPAKKGTNQTSSIDAVVSTFIDVFLISFPKESNISDLLKIGRIAIAAGNAAFSSAFDNKLNPSNLMASVLNNTLNKGLTTLIEQSLQIKEQGLSLSSTSSELSILALAIAKFLVTQFRQVLPIADLPSDTLIRTARTAAPLAATAFSAILTASFSLSSALQQKIHSAFSDILNAVVSNALKKRLSDTPARTLTRELSNNRFSNLSQTPIRSPLPAIAFSPMPNPPETKDCLDPFSPVSAGDTAANMTPWRMLDLFNEPVRQLASSTPAQSPTKPAPSRSRNKARKTKISPTSVASSSDSKNIADQMTTSSTSTSTASSGESKYAADSMASDLAFRIIDLFEDESRFEEYMERLEVMLKAELTRSNHLRKGLNDNEVVNLNSIPDRPDWTTGTNGMVEQLIKIAKEDRLFVHRANKPLVLEIYNLECTPIFGAGKDHINSWSDIWREIKKLTEKLNDKKYQSNYKRPILKRLQSLGYISRANNGSGPEQYLPTHKWLRHWSNNINNLTFTTTGTNSSKGKLDALMMVFNTKALYPEFIKAHSKANAKGFVRLGGEIRCEDHDCTLLIELRRGLNKTLTNLARQNHQNKSNMDERIHGLIGTLNGTSLREAENLLKVAMIVQNVSIELTKSHNRTLVKHLQGFKNVQKAYEESPDRMKALLSQQIATVIINQETDEQLANELDDEVFQYLGQRPLPTFPPAPAAGTQTNTHNAMVAATTHSASILQTHTRPTVQTAAVSSNSSNHTPALSERPRRHKKR